MAEDGERNPMVDHPDHYNQLDAKCSGCGKRIECIDVIEGMTLCVGNAVKYLWRLGFKGDVIEQIDKAIWYLQRERARRLAQATTEGGAQ